MIFLILRKSSVSGGVAIETVKRQNLVQSVSTTGSVVSSTDLSLSFAQERKVSNVSARVGQKVKKGDALAALSNSTERSTLAVAKKDLLAARAKYNKVLEGSSNEEITLAQAKLDTTKKTQANLVATARRALYSDDLIAESENTNTDVAPVISGTYNGTTEGQYTLSFNAPATNKIQYSGLEKGTVIVGSIPKPLGTKGLLIAFNGSSYSASDTWKIIIPNKSGSNYTKNLAAYQSALSAQDQAITKAQADLDLKRATARQPEVDAALADMVTAQAAVDAANTALEKTILRAPTDGTVTAVFIKAGTTTVPGKTVIGLKDISNLYLEATLSGNEAKNIAVGQPVIATFDAFSGKSYRATISSIDQVATAQDAGASYKIKALLTETENIHQDMTAHMTIQTVELTNVLVLPARVIQTLNGNQSVMLVSDDRRTKATPRIITTGLIGDGDLVEIQSGLVEGDRVLGTPSAIKPREE